ncbi:MAG: hypothetical protein AAGM22_32135 [Acidobacteriota bacterium]
MPLPMLYLAVAWVAVAGPDPAPPPWQPPPQLVAAVKAQIPPQSSSMDRMRWLHHFLVSPEGLGVVAADQISETSESVWRTRRADCVGFAYLLGGIARELGLPVSFGLESPGDVEPTASSGPFQVREAHIVLIFMGSRDGPWLVDHEGFRPWSPETRRLDDREAAALLWANRGARALLAGRCKDALQLTTTASLLAPRIEAIQRNQEVAQSRCALEASRGVDAAWNGRRVD